METEQRSVVRRSVAAGWVVPPEKRAPRSVIGAVGRFIGEAVVLLAVGLSLAAGAAHVVGPEVPCASCRAEARR